ncbi:DUF1761 domain-containing protein [Limimaricola hongkongensis]|uniref:DUF1761 domain-containing protein n=1 Tax=Limimaricola hongkongensis DSM 17492 TaxID=1122180 RepID=A0A017HFB6_9RHOB|nr:DUF1761 domain-containing protein [Limimaricola hongkongensis]EYD73197.1 hypothetical protein Lokhon_00724 [Limimaricola hongkongensis DSM 17492]
MAIVSILLAALASFALGSVWYMSLAKPWMAASGVPVGEDGKPVNGSSPTPYLVSFVAMLIIAATMRYGFGLAGIATPVGGLFGGLAVGALFIAPWITLNCGYAGRPWSLAVIDGGYAALGCAAMGLVLGLF